MVLVVLVSKWWVHDTVSCSLLVHDCWCDKVINSCVRIPLMSVCIVTGSEYNTDTHTTRSPDEQGQLTSWPLPWSVLNDLQRPT